MKKKTTKIALLLSLLLFSGVAVSVAANTNPVVYDVLATTPTPCPTNYYDECEGLSGSALSAKLRTINKPKNPSYDWTRYEDADEALDDSSSILCVYTRHNIKKGNHCGSYSWTTWNREHVWTQTAWPESKTDNHNIFACEGQINNTRNNFLYNAVAHTDGNRQVVFGHTTDCYFDGSYFEPCDEAKGEIARSLMYGAVMYSRDLEDEIYSVELALKWHLEHPNTERDVRRNNIVHTNQGNRNMFVDNPDYACKIWGQTNAATKALCGSTPVVKTLESIEVTTSNHRTFKVGDTFVGEQIKAHYSDGSSSVVEGSFKGYDLSKVGIQTVTVSYTEGGVTKTTTYSITVQNTPIIEVESVSVDKSLVSLEEGASSNVVFTVLPTYATNKEIEISVADSNVATVSTSGSIKALKAGTTSVTVTSVSNKSASCSFEVNVTPKHEDHKLVSLIKEHDPIKTEYYREDPINLYGLKMTGVYDDGSKKDVTDLVSYTVHELTDKTKAEVYLDVQGISAGLFTITYKEGTAKTEDKAFDYALSFEESIDSYSVRKEIPKSAWTTLETQFNKLDSATKQYYKELKYEQSSNEVSAANSTDEILKTVKEYDQIVIERLSEGFNDFMGRNPKPKEANSSNYDMLIKLLKITMFAFIGIALLVTLLRLITKRL